MNTFILMWNPTISSFKIKDFQEMIPEYDWAEMNWSIWDHKKVQDGDRIFLARVGEGNTGIVMAGTVYGEPYQGKDWSGKGRETFYVDFSIDEMVDSENAPVLTTKELTKAMPDFDWTGGHSGRILPKEYQVKLELMWLAFLNANQETFDGERGSEFYFDSCTEVSDILQTYLNKERGNVCEVCGYDYQKNWGSDCEELNSHYVFWDDKSIKRPYYDLLKRIKCLCNNCSIINYEKQKAYLLKK